MAYIQNELIKKILTLWKKEIGLNQQDFYELLALTGSAEIKDSELKKKIDESIKTLSENAGKISSFNLTKEISEYATPWNPDTIKMSFSNWINKKVKINKSTAASLSVLLSLISFKNNDLFLDINIPYFTEKTYPAKLLLDEYGPLVGLSKGSDLYGKILNNSDNLATFLFSLFLYSREEIEGKRNLKALRDELSLWLEKVNLDETPFSEDEILKSFEKQYYKELWELSEKIYLRDSNNNPYNIAENKPDIANLYVLPTLSSHTGDKIKTPLRGEGPVKLLVEAVTGSGKSTLIRAIITSILNNRTDEFLDKPLSDELKSTYKKFRDYFGLPENIFPVVIICDKNSFNGKKLKKAKVSDLALGVRDKKLFKELLKEKKEKHVKCLLLIDGLDEIPGEKKRSFNEIIRKFIEKNRNISLLITSRPVNLNTFSSILETVNRLNLDPFEEKQRDELIDKWISQDSIHSEEQEKQYYKEILSNEYLEELMKNPYLLTHTLSSLKELSVPTPNQIISELIDQLIYKRSNLDDNYIDSSLLRNILSEIALEMVKKNETLIDQRELDKLFEEKTEDILRDIVPDPSKWLSILRDINDRAGLIVATPKGFKFQYPIIEKYLAAEAIKNELREEYELITSVPDYTLYASLERIFPENLNSYWTDIALILLTPKTTQGRDKLTENIFRFFLNKASETLNRDELINIGKLFIYLPLSIFGNSSAVNRKNDNISPGRELIIRFLLQNEHLFENLSDLKSLDYSLEELLESETFLNEYEHLKNQGLVKVKTK